MAKDKIDELYEALKADGLVEKDRDNFRNYILAPGEQGYRNRVKLYNALKADELVDSKSYEEFRDRLGLRAVPAPDATPAPPAANSLPQQQATASVGQPINNETVHQASAQSDTSPVQRTGWKPSPMQQQAFRRQMDEANARLKKQGEEYQRRMEGIKKGNRHDAFMGEREFNPATGEMETAYYTTQGERVPTSMQQRKANSDYHQWWENNTEAGQRSKEQRLQREFDDRLSRLWDRPERYNAAEQAWSAAESAYNSAVERNRENTNMMVSNFAMNSSDAVAFKQMETVDNFTDRLTTHDLDALMDNAWNNLGEEGQKALIDDCYQMLRYRNPGADGLVLYNQAKEFARQQSDLRMYNLAVEKNLPKSDLEYFMRKIGDMNLVTNISKGIAVNRVKKTGDMAAYEAANEQYRQDGHKILDVTGMVAGFALDPTTWMSAGVGGAAARGSMWLGGRWLAGRGASAAVTQAATRQFATSMTGRIVGGIAGGAANFGTFEGIKEIENQFAHGGHIVGQDEVGRYINEGYSAGAVGGQALHGLMMGGAVGWLGPVSGNVSDQLVRATSSTLGKVATRAGVYTGATLAEGTIFSVPEWIEGKRDAMDVWNDNMAMMVGFKAKHMLKSAGGVLGDLKASFDSPTNGQNNRLDFESRLRQRMDAPTDGGMALTEDEKAELKRYGYDLRDLVESSERTGNPAEGSLIAQNAPEIVSRLTDMVTDPRVSEAARAKMYYYATGRRLPMSTVMRGELIEDGDGGFIVESQGANGIITSRSFKSRKAADLELERIKRQTELNSIEIGERYQQTTDFENRLQEACRTVAAENGWDMVEVYRTCEEARRNHLRGGDKQFEEVQQNILRKVTDEMGEFEETGATDEIRGRINEKYGVDIDGAIRKEANRRTLQEQTAIDEYIAELIPEKAKEPNPVEDAEAEDLTNQKLLSDEPAAPQGPGEGEPIDPRFDNSTSAPEYDPHQSDRDLWPTGRAVMKFQDRPVEVLNGRVVMMEDGSMVDSERSDASIVIRDLATGKMEMVSPDAILSYEAYPETLSVEETEVMQGTAAPESEVEPQSRYTSGQIKIRNSDGTETRGVLTGYVDENGNHEYYVEGDLQHLHYASEQELNNILSEYVPDEPLPEQTAPIEPGPAPVQPANEQAPTVPNQPETVPTSGETPRNPTETVPNSAAPVENVQETAAPAAKPTPLQRIPRDAKGEPIFEQAENPEHGWDALVEFAEGDVSTAKEIADTMAEEKLKAYEKAQKQKPKGKTPTEILASKKAISAGLAQAEQEYNLWQQMANVEQRRQDAIRALQEAESQQRAAERVEAEKAEREAREEAARLEREALEGIPEWHLDTPENARKRGVRRFSGQMFTRQEPVHGVVGNEVEVKFSQKDLPKGHVAVIEALQLQPSHIQGQRNPMFFIEEAQPKNRAETVSMFAAKEMAEGIRPQEITGSATAYTGAPTINARGEVIQGNNRSDALRYLWENKLPEQQRTYKQYLIDNAEQFGIDPEAVNAMQQPVLVNMLDVDDVEAIRLGQMTAQDTESGGIERIKPKNVAQKLGEDMRSFASQLLRSGDEEASFGQLVDRNGTEVLKWMAQKGAITNTQYQSAFDSKGNLTAEAKNDLQKVLYQAVFKGGSQQLEEMFDALSAKAQRAILSTAFRDMDSPFAGKMLPEIQASIAAYNQLMNDPSFAAAKKMEETLRVVEGFKRSIQLDDRFEQYMPADNFSNFALHLAAMYKANDMSQTTLASYFNQMYDLAQGKKAATLFEEADTTEYPLADVIKQVLNIDYKPAKNGNNNVANGGADVALRNQDGQGGELRGNEPPASGEQNPTGTEASDRGAGTSDHSRGGGNLRVGGKGETTAQEERLTKEEASGIIAEMEEKAIAAPEIELTIENWDAQFGEDGIVSTPIGNVKMGENQFTKLMRQGRNGKLGMIKPTLETPDIIIEDASEAKDTAATERESSYVFVKTFVKPDGSRYYYFTSVTVSKDGHEVIISNQEKRRNVLTNLLMKGKLVWKHADDASSASDVADGFFSPQGNMSDPVSEGTDAPQTNDSDRKISNSASEKQISGTESSVQPSDNKGEQTVQTAVEAASAQVNTEPTPAQAEAGNYKKGHVTIGEFDITIENPAGSVRKGVDADGKEWSNTMANTYGYIKGTEGADGDHIDVFLHSDMDQWNGRKVFVVDQTNTDGSFDEHKVMLGFNDKDEAMTAYLANYDKTWADTHPGLRISETNIEDFNKWVQSSHRKTKPFADYTTVSKVVDKAPVKTEPQQPGQTAANIGEGYKIESKPYTNKQGKTLDTYLVTFDRLISKEEFSALRAKAKALKGWYDRETKGWMLRSSEDAKAFAEDVIGKSEDEVADEAPLSMADMEKPKPAAKPTESPMKQVDVEGVFDALKTKGETKLSDHAKPVEAPKPKKRRWISDEDAYEFDSLRKDLRNHFGKDGDIVQEAGAEYGKPKPKQMDAEVLRMGTRMTYLMMKGGLRSFSDYCEAMKDELPVIFDDMRPHLKSLYAAAQNMEEVIELGWDEEMDDRKTVKAFDVYNFDKPGAKDIIATAQHAVDENASQQQTDQIIQTLKDQRNEQRKKEADETSADTEAVIDKAETTASQVESKLEAANSEEDAEGLSRSLDKELEEVNKQLALLGYYEADPVDKDFFAGAKRQGDYNEAYGYMRNAERKAVQDAHRLATQLAADLGITIDPKDKVRKAKYGFGSKIARSNVAPAGGEVYITLPLAEGRELSIWLSLDKNEPWRDGGREDSTDEDLMLTGIMYRVENTGKGGMSRYESSNHNTRPTIPYDELLSDIRRLVRTYLPEAPIKPATPLTRQPGEDIVDMAKRVASDKKPKAPAVEPRQTMASLFGDELENFDNQGNPIDRNGKYIVEAVKSVSELSDDDFMNPTRNVVLPELQERVSDAIGAEGRKPMIKKNIFGKNRDSHKDLTAEDGRGILNEVLYNPDLYGQNQKESRPYNWIMVHLSGKNSAVVLEVNPTKDYLEIVNWHYIGEEALERKKRQAVKEGGRILTLSLDNAAANTHDGLSSDSKVNDKSFNNQLNEKTDVQPRTEGTGRGGQQPRPDEPLGEGAKNENERTDGGRMAQRGGEHSVSDSDRGAGVSGLHQSERGVTAPRTPAAPKNTRNNHAERGTDYAPKGEKARIDANIAALELAKKLLASGRAATPQEMAILRRYSGWGGLGAAFNEGSAWAPNPVNKRLREALTPEEYQAAVMSRNSAYYTPAAVIDAMWDVAKALGFKGGNIVEGSAGIGNIIGLMPTDISERSNIHAVEIDPTTGGILSLLYPDAQVEVQGFEQTRIANGSVDLAITNVPFVTDLHVMDESGDSDLSKKFRDIHDFCIAKNVRKLREGGIGIFITSSGTLDKSQKLRNWLVGDKEGNADVVGVFRMNNQTFGGTAATSDIIVVRKRVNGRRSANAIDVSTVTPARTATFTDARGKTKDLPLYVNRYFIEHPEHMGGEMFFGFEQGDTYRPTSIGLFPTRTADQSARMAAWVQHLADMDWSKEHGKAAAEQTSHINEALGEGVKEGSMVIDSEGNLCVARMGRAVPLTLNKNKIKGRTKEECFKDYTEIKSALADVLKYQTEHDDDAGLQPLLDRLNRAYDTFVQRYGNLNKNNNLAWLRNDVDFSSIVALETYSEKGNKDGTKVKTYGKTDIFSHRVVEKESEPTPKNVKDGIIASIYKYGRIDTEYLATQLGKSQDDVKQEIVESGLGFVDPTTGQMEVSYEYLSGNVREKLRQAREANEAAGGAYDANIKALEAVVPMNIPAHLIEFALGSSWIEPQLYERYVKERTELDVKLTNAGGTWHMGEPWNTDKPKNTEMGVRSEAFGILIPGHKLIEAALTNKTITVSRTVKDSDGGSHTETDPAATTACATKVDEIRQDFKDWAREQMQNDPALSMRMEEKYNEKFNNTVPKSIPDEFVPEHFGGAATTVGGVPFKLRPHQAKAVIRATTQPVLLAHEVGTGKTYTLITTAMEMRRLGTARKPMIVVQNATVGQFVASAKALYPNAKVLTLEDADRNAEGRKAFYAKIKFNDWDMIVVPQSVFERIPDSIERQTQFIQNKIEEKMLVLEQMKEADPDGRSMIVRAAEREISRLEDEMSQLASGEEPTSGKKKKDAKKAAITRQNAEVKARELLDRATDDVEDFDSMGIDAILVDEAHEYKHLGFATAMQRSVKGVDPSPSKKSQGVFLKAQAVLEKTGGKNVVFATGTPISNTAAEIWTFMRYLIPADVMKEYDIYYFDDFVRNFGNLQQMMEFKTDGKFGEVNRFAGYVNLPELVRIWSTVADTVLTREAGGVSDKIPQIEGGKAQDIFLPQTRALRSIMKFVKDELKRYEDMTGKEKRENSHVPLVMYGIAKASAVDSRLVQSDAEDDPKSKTNEAVRQTLRTLEETKQYKGTVAIFADNYQNKHSGFNLYEDIRKKLIAAGVPEEQVVVMKPGMKINKKLEIFTKVNAGEVRVVMGSTFTLGTGVNIQERLHTLIHLDAPNRPMDYTQRNGRILRQGNLHNTWGLPVRVLRFGVEDSLDVTAYQRLKTKGAIADSIMNGKQLMANSMENRSLEEDQDLFGDITAQLSGSEYAMLKNQIEKEVRKLRAAEKNWKADQTYIHNRKRQIAGQNREAEKRIADNESYLEKVEAATIGDITVGKLSFPSVDAMEDFFTEQNKKKAAMQEEVRTSGYSSRPATSDITISVGGFDFKIHTEITKEMKHQQGDLFATAPAKMTYSCPELGIDAMPVRGNAIKNAVLDIMENVVSGKDFRERIANAENYLERNNAELEAISKRDGQPFKDAEALAKAEEKLAEYEEMMKAEMAAKEAKYAEMDKDVEAAAGVELTEEDSEPTASEPAVDYSSRSEAALPVTAENANFAVGQADSELKVASRYETKDGKTVRYTSENPEAYGGLFDFDFSNDVPGAENTAEGGRVNRRQQSNPPLQRRNAALLDTNASARLNEANGEYCALERKFRESNYMEFTSAEKVESADDVAFIFEELENASVENVFVVMTKRGVPTVMHISIGGFNWSAMNAAPVKLAFDRIKPDKVYFVHNHPSGALNCSAQDVNCLKQIEGAIGKKAEGVIMNLKSGKYGTFDSSGTDSSASHDKAPAPAVQRRLRLYAFDRHVFNPDYQPSEKMGNAQDVAKFLSSHRLGDRSKVSVLVCNNQNQIVANVHTTHISIDSKGLADDIIRAIGEFGGMHAFLYGDFEQSGMVAYRNLSQAVKERSGGVYNLLDVVRIEGNHTWSARDNGYVYEPGSEYGASYVQGSFPTRRSEGQFDAIREQAITQRGIVLPGLSNAEVNIVNIPRHDFTGTGKQAIKKAYKWATDNLVGEHWYHQGSNDGFRFQIDEDAIGKYLSSSSTKGSDNLGIHLACLKRLPAIIDNSIEAEIHADYTKANGRRIAENGVQNPDILMHRYYGAVRIEGKLYRVKTTIKETRKGGIIPYNYQVTELELLISGSETSDALSNSNRLDGSKLLKDVEKSYDPGKKLLNESGKSDEEAKIPADIRFREVEDDAVLKEFAEGKTVKAYRTMQVIGSKLYSPMATKVGGKATPEIKLGVPEQAEEHPEIIKRTKVGRDGVTVGYVVIDKGLGKGTLEVAYNPSIHASRTALNDQFTSAHIRPNLVTVEVEIPLSELTSGYRANMAKDAVGEISWHSGTVSGQLAELGKPRRVILSRYDRPVRIVPFKEVAAMIAEQLDGTDIEIPYNVVTPQVRMELQHLGIAISDTPSGSVGENRDFGKAEYITDQEIERINAHQQEMAQTSPEAKSSHAEKLAKKLNTPIEVVTDPKELTSDNAGRQARIRRSKGFYDPATGKVVVVLPNNANVEDVAETVFHEVVAHKGLREMLGDENYDAFCDEVYKHLKDDLKEEVDRETTRGFVREPEKGYEHHRRVSVDELFGRMAEKGFEDFTEAERGIWGKLKAKVLEAINKFLGSLKLPKWVTLGDNELRYMLWRSHEKLRTKGDYVNMARDAAKRDELGLNRSDAIKKRKATSDIDEVNRGFNEQLKRWEAGELRPEEVLSAGNPMGVMRQFMPEISIVIRQRVLTKSRKKHGLSAREMQNLPGALAKPIFVFKSNEETVSVLTTLKSDSGENLFVAVELGKDLKYGGRTMEVNDILTVHGREVENIVLPIVGNHSLVWADKKKGLEWLHSAKSNSQAITTQTLEDAANIVNTFDNPTITGSESFEYRFRDGGETGDIWKDQSVGLQERITNAAIRLSNKQSGDLTLRGDAQKAVVNNLQSLLVAMRNRGRTSASASAQVKRGVTDVMNAQAMFDRATVKRVSDLARILMQNGYLSGMTSGEMQRLLSVVKNATAMHDISDSVQKIMDIMVNNQLRNAEGALRQLLSIRGSKVDARGVEVQGVLDVDGQRTMEVVKKAMSLTEDDINDRIAEALNRMSDPDQTIADQAAIEYAGLNMALDYVQNIAGSKSEEKTLRDSLKTAKEDRDAGRMTDDAYKQFVEATEDAIRKNKVERAEAYFNLVGRLSGSLRESIGNAKAFREAEKARVNKIHHHANSDMEGRPHYAHGKNVTKADKLSNLLAGSIMSPLGTFEQHMRVFGSKSIDGRGYLFEDYVVGLQKCRDREWLDLQRVENVLNQKASKVLGKKKAHWTELNVLARETAGRVKWWDGGEMREHTVTQGNLMYIYMADKMTDGRVKLRKMCIGEEMVGKITKALNPTLREVADWLQEEFLPEFREEINEVYMRMYGAPMAAIDLYFPLRTLANAREQKEDISQFVDTDGLPKTITGALVKRVFNTCDLDILHSNPVDIAIDHVRELLEWKNMAEYRRDLGTLLSYKLFRNRVKNMTTIYGSGEQNWKRFKKLAMLVGGAHLPETNDFDKAMVNLTKLATGACIALNFNSAIKQLLSYPAFLPEANAARLVYNMTPWRARYCWKWAMENMPAFQRRWMSRQSGNDVLREFDGDWDWTKKDFIQKIQRLGMSPNAFIDGLTIAMGSEAVFHNKFKEYRKYGYPEKIAREKAITDSEITFNLSQQSSETMYLSLIQNSRSFIAKALTNFRNSSMSYSRQIVQAIREGRNMAAHRKEQIEFETKKAVREGLDEADARRMAKHRYNRQWAKVITAIATFAAILPGLWYYGLSGLWYLFFGADEEKKKDDAKNALLRGVLLGWAEGFVGGGTMPDLLYSWMRGKSVNFDEQTTPASASFADVVNAWANGKTDSAINETVNFAVSMGLGVNPQYVENAVAACLDFFGHDEKSRKDYEMLVLRLMSVPQSQLDEIYIDELGLSGKEAGTLTPAQLAQRYAEYKVKRGYFLTPWSWEDEALIDKEKKRIIKMMKERLDAQGDARVIEAYADFEARYKAVSEKVKEAKALMETDYAADQAHAMVQQDPDFGLYQRFGELDKELGHISKMWLSAKSPQEAALVASTITSYRAGMVKVLQAENEESQQSAMSELTALTDDFYAKYQGMQPKQVNR